MNGTDRDMKEMEPRFVLMQVEIILSEGQDHETATPVEPSFLWFKTVSMSDLKL